MEIAKFPGPPPSFLCFCTAGGEKSGGAWNQSKWIHVYTLRHYYPFLPSHNHCYAHTHTVQGDCSVQWKVGLAAVQCWLSAQKDPWAKERLWGTDPTLHGQTGTATRTVIVFLLLFTISLCQLLLFAPYTWKLARRVYRSSRCDSCQTFSVDACYSPNPKPRDKTSH